ncbi:WD repeat-containing protein 46 [Trichonephila inaurata madagascariensis]|uniref:WD repeat-containing protein 46 n=1 Tax=Trichonephila inaurata madagascariensis TaxID=2747483 RepID=A0A8X6X0U6_9ARAC|nr:WD repeat-containing protein 46 [Trichonephila inaurata madagascariensis]
MNEIGSNAESSDPFHGDPEVPIEKIKSEKGQSTKFKQSDFSGVESENSFKKQKAFQDHSKRNKKKLLLRNKFVEDEKYFDPFPREPEVPIEKIKKYERGPSADYSGIKIKNLRVELMKSNEKNKQSVRQAARNELLLTEEAGYIEPDENEDIYNITQHDIAAQVDITSASKLFSLSLTDFGPYKINYSRDGRHLLLGGRLGHVAAMDWVTKRLLCEINVMESVHAISWLHLSTMFATAQKNWVFIYDNQGVELHCIKAMHRVLQMEFLPYHFLLATSSERGILSWLDTCVGKMVKQNFTSAGRLNVMCQNPYNATIVTGHPNGTVSMWSPNVDKPLVRMLCSATPIKSIAIDNKGLYMATATMDRNVKIFDVRTYKCLQSYKLKYAAGFLDFSQRGLLSAGMGDVVEVYKDCCTQIVSKPYLQQRFCGTVSDVKFCPFEDVLGIGHSSGFLSILIPGAGEPNIDSFENNPFQSKSQRREMEVKALLDKIQPELITLDPGHLGAVNVPNLKEKMERLESKLLAKSPKIEFQPRERGKFRSKSAIMNKRKLKVKETARREFFKKRMSAQKEVQEKHNVLDTVSNEKKHNVLDRFRTKKK